MGVFFRYTSFYHPQDKHNSMKNTAVKFCGFTQLEDITNAVNLGVDAVGFVFYEPSPRAVTAEQACEACQSGACVYHGGGIGGQYARARIGLSIASRAI